jgi:hypothetical protein
MISILIQLLKRPLYNFLCTSPTTLKCQSPVLHRSESSLMKRDERVTYGFVDIWGLVYPVVYTTHIVLCTWFLLLLVIVYDSPLLLANIYCAICNKSRIRSVIVWRRRRHYLIKLRFIHVLKSNDLEKKNVYVWEHMGPPCLQVYAIWEFISLKPRDVIICEIKNSSRNRVRTQTSSPLFPNQASADHLRIYARNCRINTNFEIPR